MSAILKRQARRREVLHNALAVEVHHADAVGSRRQTRLRRLVEPALRGLKVLRASSGSTLELKLDGTAAGVEAAGHARAPPPNPRSRGLEEKLCIARAARVGVGVNACVELIAV